MLQFLLLPFMHRTRSVLYDVYQMTTVKMQTQNNHMFRVMQNSFSNVYYE